MSMTEILLIAILLALTFFFIRLAGARRKKVLYARLDFLRSDRAPLPGISCGNTVCSASEPSLPRIFPKRWTG